MTVETAFKNIADAIRERGGTSGALTPAEMPQAIMDIPAGGNPLQCFDVFRADFAGYTKTVQGMLNNNYLVAFFHDNMQTTYTLNGTSYSFPVNIGGRGIARVLGTTQAVTNPPVSRIGDILQNEGSTFTTVHGDNGSYASVVGGWYGYDSGGSIYEQAAVAAYNEITMQAAHSKLLVFVAGSDTTLNGATTVNVNGVTYPVVNMGTGYDSVYSIYSAFVIDNNADTTIRVTFPASCYNFVSIIGIN